MSGIGALSPYLVLILVGVLPNEVWRWLGLGLVRGLNEKSEIVLLARAVATAILAGVIAKLVLFSGGALAGIPLPVRLTATAAGFAGYLIVKRSIFAGVLVGEIVLIAGGLFFTAP